MRHRTSLRARSGRSNVCAKKNLGAEMLFIVGTGNARLSLLTWM
jgi:hypothetical protein